MLLSLSLLATLSAIVPAATIACLLLLLAAAAFGLWKGRSAPLGRRIRILETASLGPKRALIVAEVNGVTMVIGASEAGIALLTAPTPATDEGAIPSNEETAADERDSPFGARATSHSIPSMLIETMEHQAPRRRLSARFSGKTS